MCWSEAVGVIDITGTIGKLGAAVDVDKVVVVDVVDDDVDDVVDDVDVVVVVAGVVVDVDTIEARR
jgi:hypothetical protein